MPTPFTLPHLGENIENGDVVTVFVSVGDIVKPGQALLEVETDKAVIEVPCTPGGQVTEVLVKKGDTIRIGQTLVMLEMSGEAVPVVSKVPGKSPAVPSSSKPVAPVVSGDVRRWRFHP